MSTSFTARHTMKWVCGLVATAAALAMAAAPQASASTVNQAPIGHLDRVVSDGDHAVLIGWAADPMYPTNSIDVGVGLLDHSQRTLTTPTWSISHDSRPDVARAHPELGANHGFTIPVTVDHVGTFRVCIDALGRSSFVTSLGCVTVSITADRAPIGHLDSVRAVGNNHLQIVGWAADQDHPASGARVDLSLGGVHPFNIVRIVASGPRPDVAKAHPELGAAHGFSLTIAAKPGTYPVCANALGSGATDLAGQLGCITVTV